jgi:uncharacterized protein YbbC (DUF1343 family)
MKTRFGLDHFLEKFPPQLQGKRLGVLCHNPSITSSYVHVIDAIGSRGDCVLSAIFGPQHGLFGQTQDNMVEWEGEVHPVLKIPVYSLYGKTRVPTKQMLSSIDALVIDLQDVGARPYTYVWTVKNCLDACGANSIPVWVLDRPNPIGALQWDGPMLKPEYFSFVGGAEIPLCHRLTLGEIALLMREACFPKTELHIVWMENWWRNSFWNETGLPWVLPSPNMPTLDTAIVYPGMVLLEATNLSEGRGTARPFEIFGAPFLRIKELKAALQRARLPGCVFREHGFIPTFQKWQQKFCKGMQIHCVEPRQFLPVTTTAVLLQEILRSSGSEFAFKDPPYEYETVKQPFDILAGSDRLRHELAENRSWKDMRDGWIPSYAAFKEVFGAISHYPEEPSW